MGKIRERLSYNVHIKQPTNNFAMATGLIQLSVPHSSHLSHRKKLKRTSYLLINFAVAGLLQPRSQGSLLPAPWSERERDPGKRWSRACLPESGRLQTNDLEKGQVSVRFVPTDRRQVSVAMKLCT